LEQAGDDECVRRQFSFTQHAQQIFARVGQLLEPLEAEEAGGSLYGMHRTENIRQQGGIVRPLLQVGQTAFHAVKPFLAFNQEFPRQFVHRILVSACRRKKPARNLPMALSDGQVLT
jgi:hypothetical protein